MEIRVIGQDCSRCRRAYDRARRAITIAGVPAMLVKVDDLSELVALHALAIPAIAINGVLKSVGRVPRAAEIAEWLREGHSPSAGQS